MSKDSKESLSAIIPELARYNTASKSISPFIFIKRTGLIARRAADNKLSKDTKAKIKSLFWMEYLSATAHLSDFLNGLPNLNRDERNHWHRKLTTLFGKAKDLLFETLDNSISNQQKFDELAIEEFAIYQGLGFESGSSGTAGDEKASDGKTSLEPKPPEFLQNLLWILQYGRRHWKLILFAILILLTYSVLQKFDLFTKSGLSK